MFGVTKSIYPPIQTEKALSRFKSTVTISLCYLLLGFSYEATASESILIEYPVKVLSGSYFASGFTSQSITNGMDDNHGDPVFSNSFGFNPAGNMKIDVSATMLYGIATDRSEGDSSSFELDEFDARLSASQSFTTWLSGSLEVNYYHYLSEFYSGDGEDKHDAEVVLGVEAALRDSGAVGLTYQRGLDKGIQGNVISGAVSMEQEIYQKLSLVSEITASAANQFGVPFDFAELTIRAAPSYELKGLSIEPSVTFYWVPKHESLGTASEAFVVAGLDLTYTF